MSVPKVKVRAAQLSMESLLKLLGGSDDDRRKFWEILKGTTTPQNLRIANRNIVVVNNAAKAMQASVKALQKVVKSTARN